MWKAHPVSFSLSLSLSLSPSLTVRQADLAVVDDGEEALGLEGRPADEDAVDVGLDHDAGDVAGGDAAAVEDPDGLGRIVAVAAGDTLAQEGLDLLRLVGGGHAARPDRPHRLVGDDHARPL